MLRMDQVHVIRDQVLRAGRSIRSVAKELGVSRKTVAKYLREPEPSRRETSPRRQPVREVIGDRFEELWRDWQDRSSDKHRVTGAGLWRQLVSEGFSVSEITVRRMVRERRLSEMEVYVPLVHRPGDNGQVDFFEVVVEVSGSRRKAWLFLLHLPCSGRSYCRIYDRCDQLSFLDGHVRAFGHLDGLPSRLVYDNLKAAVRRRVAGAPKLTVRFQALLSPLHFRGLLRSSGRRPRQRLRGEARPSDSLSVPHADPTRRKP